MKRVTVAAALNSFVQENRETDTKEAHQIEIKFRSAYNWPGELLARSKRNEIRLKCFRRCKIRKMTGTRRDIDKLAETPTYLHPE